MDSSCQSPFVLVLVFKSKYCVLWPLDLGRTIVQRPGVGQEATMSVRLKCSNFRIDVFYLRTSTLSHVTVKLVHSAAVR